MTMTTNPETSENRPVAEDSEMGGSPGDFRADDLDEMVPEETDEGPTDEGMEPESGGEPGVPDAHQQRITELENQLGEMSGMIDQIGAEMERDPEFAARVSRIGRGGPPSSDLEADFRSRAQEALEPAAAAAIETSMEPVFEYIRSLEKRITGMAPRLDKMSREVGTRQFSEALDANGVSASVQRSPEFQAHLRSLRAKPAFQRNEAHDPKFAAEHAAYKWNLSRATRNGNADERSRLTAAKSGRSARRAPGSPSLAEQIVKIKRQPHRAHLEQAKRVRFDAARNGRDIPKIVFED